MCRLVQIDVNADNLFQCYSHAHHLSECQRQSHSQLIAIESGKVNWKSLKIKSAITICPLTADRSIEDHVLVTCLAGKALSLE